MDLGLHRLGLLENDAVGICNGIEEEIEQGNRNGPALVAAIREELALSI